MEAYRHLQVATNQVNQMMDHGCMINVVSRWKQMQIAANHQEQHDVVYLHLYLGTKPEPVSPARSPLFRPGPSPARPEGQWALAGTARGAGRAWAEP